MGRPWFSAEKGRGEGFAVVKFVRLVAAAVVSCFFGCFCIKDSRSHIMSAPQKRPTSHDEDAHLSLISSDDDSLRNRVKAPKRLPEGLDSRELKNEAKFLKACGTLPETPVEIRKTSGNWVDTSAKKEESLSFNSWLPTVSIEKLKLQHDQSPPRVKYCEEWSTEVGSLVDTPSICTTDDNPRRNSISFMQSNDIESHSSEIRSVSPVVVDTSIIRGKNKSVRFECQSDNSFVSSETSCQHSKASGGNSSIESKASPYPTPLRLTDEMQTPGTVFPAYSNNMADGKANRIRSQYVYSELNQIVNPIIWEDLVDGNSDSDQSGEFLEPNPEEPLMPVGRTPGDRPILGTVAAKWSDVNGIPNSTNKYKEDQKVKWHATPFEERLEKALSDGPFVSQRKPIIGTLPVEFKETEEFETSSLQVQSPAPNSDEACQFIIVHGR